MQVYADDTGVQAWLVRLEQRQYEGSTLAVWSCKRSGRRQRRPTASREEVDVMTVSAQIAIYPLRQDHLTPAIETVQQASAVGW
jgi:hypothetical protein